MQLQALKEDMGLFPSEVETRWPVETAFYRIYSLLIYLGISMSLFSQDNQNGLLYNANNRNIRT